MPRTPSRKRMSRGLLGVREAGLRNRKERFTALLHHVNPESLQASYHALKRGAAPGIDGVRWEEYGVGLEEKLKDLSRRIHTGAYRAQPSRAVAIPKANGGTRLLGIAALEDKIVQHAMKGLLEQIYEPSFLGYSYGFRPNRGAHDALDALYVGLHRRRVNWVIDADLKSFFDSLDHDQLIRLLEHRIADRRVIRLIGKWLKAGILMDAQVIETSAGTPQGGVISPLLANIYLHYVLDLWVYHWRRRHARGHMIYVRYADDFVLGFEHREEAERFLAEMRARLQGYGLELHPEKTRLIPFGARDARERERRGGGGGATFDFLGFTHYWGKNRKGYFFPQRKTIGKRLRKKLSELKQKLKERASLSLEAQGRWVRQVCEGWFNYFAVAGNLPALHTFRTAVGRHWLHALRRRGDTRRMTWRAFQRLCSGWLPTVAIRHAYPEQRFSAKNPHYSV
jgi:group II intron reverse transcriptase/maturase